MNELELIDLDTYYELKSAAPQVMSIPVDAARWLVKAMDELSKASKPHEDLNGQSYWEAALRDLMEIVNLSDEFSNNQVGHACRNIGLTCWRKADGYHVAWSEAQLKILRKHFGASK